MFEGFDPTQVVACALRPESSWSHMLALIGFVLAAWWLAPDRALPGRRGR